MSEAETVLYEVRDGIATVKINRPEMRNALSPAAASCPSQVRKAMPNWWGETRASAGM